MQERYAGQPRCSCPSCGAGPPTLTSTCAARTCCASRASLSPTTSLARCRWSAVGGASVDTLLVTVTEASGSGAVAGGARALWSGPSTAASSSAGALAAASDRSRCPPAARRPVLAGSAGGAGGVGGAPSQPGPAPLQPPWPPAWQRMPACRRPLPATWRGWRRPLLLLRGCAGQAGARTRSRACQGRPRNACIGRRDSSWCRSLGPGRRPEPASPPRLLRIGRRDQSASKPGCGILKAGIGCGPAAQGAVGGSPHRAQRSTAGRTNRPGLRSAARTPEHPPAVLFQTSPRPTAPLDCWHPRAVAGAQPRCRGSAPLSSSRMRTAWRTCTAG